MLAHVLLFRYTLLVVDRGRILDRERTDAVRICNSIYMSQEKVYTLPHAPPASHQSKDYQINAGEQVRAGVFASCPMRIRNARNDYHSACKDLQTGVAILLPTVQGVSMPNTECRKPSW
jgi:hypothetical protein